LQHGTPCVVQLHISVIYAISVNTKIYLAVLIIVAKGVLCNLTL